MKMFDRIRKALLIGGVIAALLMLGTSAYAGTTTPGTWEPLPTGYKKVGKIFNGADYTSKTMQFSEWAPDYTYMRNGTCSICGASGLVCTGCPVVDYGGIKARAYYMPCTDVSGYATPTQHFQKIDEGGGY